METTFTSDWFSPHIPVWETVLSDMRGKPHLHFLEIGSYEGRSACWLLTHILTHETAYLTCIDIFHLSDESIETSTRLNLSMPTGEEIEKRFDANIESIHALHKVIKLKGKSRELLRTLPLRHFDCAYIDGSHTSSSALSDGMLAFDLLKAGGLLIFDDYKWNCFPEAPLKNPRAGIDAFLTFFKDEYRIIHNDYQIIIQKI